MVVDERSSRIEAVNVKVLMLICPMNNKKEKKGELQGRGIVYILRQALIIPEKRVVYVVSIVAYQDYQDYQDRRRPHKRRKLDFHTRGTECACAQYCARG